MESKGVIDAATLEVMAAAAAGYFIGKGEWNTRSHVSRERWRNAVRFALERGGFTFAPDAACPTCHRATPPVVPK